jgi:hypothetical protein
MKSIIKLLLALIILGTISTGCKKYVDGPGFSLLPKKTRLCGDWLYEQVIYDGHDITQMVKDSAGANFKFIIEKNGSYKVQGLKTDAGKWVFGEDKDDVYFTSNAAGSTEKAFRILRLKNSELWLRSTESNGVQTVIHYIHEKD